MNHGLELIVLRYLPFLDPGHRPSMLGVILSIRSVRTARLGLILLALAACGTSIYEPRPGDVEVLAKRAETQTVGSVRVSVAVPSPEETKAIFGLPLYDRGVQPVWLEVENGGTTDLR